MIIPVPTKLFIYGKLFYSKISDNISSKFLSDDSIISGIQDDFNALYKFQHIETWFMFFGLVSLFIVFNSNIFKIDKNKISKLENLELFSNIKHTTECFSIFLTIIMIVLLKNIEPVF
jgi:hypothetical protein